MFFNMKNHTKNTLGPIESPNVEKNERISPPP